MPINNSGVRVQAGKRYVFRPCMMDIVYSQHHSAKAGDIVQVVNLSGAPKCGTMGQCHIEICGTGRFGGMVSIHSLDRLPKGTGW